MRKGVCSALSVKPQVWGVGYPHHFPQAAGKQAASSTSRAAHSGTLCSTAVISSIILGAAGLGTQSCVPDRMKALSLTRSTHFMICSTCIPLSVSRVHCNVSGASAGSLVQALKRSYALAFSDQDQFRHASQADRKRPATSVSAVSQLQYFATCHPGMEPALAAELEDCKIGAQSVEMGSSGVAFQVRTCTCSYAGRTRFYI